MNLAAAPDLTLILFAPWAAILCWLYWWYPRQPRDARRRWFDAIALALSLLAFVVSVHWAHGHADRQYGAIWPQILATALGYGVFLAALTIAVLVRWRWLRKLVVAKHPQDGTDPTLPLTRGTLSPSD